MCGIAGEIVWNNKGFVPGEAPWQAMHRVADAMAPRGPDGAGIWGAGPITFAHRRLKIIDLSDRGSQPMTDPALGLTIAFNGCIYNYKILRTQLEQQGYNFFSTSDTEVILKAFHAWGPACVSRLQGMFAFAIAERDSGRLTLVRDRLGIKPLYLAHAPGGLRFASSLPALVKGGGIDTSIDPVALNYYMAFHSVVPAPHTILRGVRKLAPATILEIEPDGRRREHRYWDVTFGPQAGDERRSRGEWEDLLLEVLRRAVRRRLVADVPVGVLLSGGLDSSLIVGLLSEEGQRGLNTFSVGFESVGGEVGDEFKYSDLIANHYATEHHKIHVDSRERLLPSLPDCVAAMAEPMVSHDAIGFFLLSQKVSQHVKVVQSGQGADEIFGGYHWYPPLAGTSDPVAAYSAAFRDRDHGDYKRAVEPAHVGTDHAAAFIEEAFGRPGAEDPVDKALRLDQQIMLVDDPVKRVDNMTMAWGLEARVPFLDHEVVELAARIPSHLKLAQEGKGILKDAGRRVIPSAVIDRPKGYFPVPALKYIEGDVLTFARDVLGASSARNRGVFRRDYVDMLLQNPSEHITPLNGSKLWQIALLELWMQTHDIS